MSAIVEPHVFKSEDVEVEIEKKPFCRVTMKVKTGKQVVQSARKAAIKMINKEASIPGFRPGKAPEEMIAQKFPAQIEKETKSQIAHLAFIAAQKVAKTPPLNSDSKVSFDLKRMDDEGAEMTYGFEVEPTIPQIDATQFELKPVKRAEVGEKERDEALLQMRFFYAQWQTISERPVYDGDYIMINLDTLENEGYKPVFNHVRFEVSRKRMAEWMYNLVLGAKVGETREGESQVDDDASEEEKKEFQPKKVRLIVLKIEEAKLPEVNEEFAKKVGSNTTEEMMQNIERILNNNANDAVKKAQREQANHFLLEKFPFDLPLSVVQDETNFRMVRVKEDPSFQKMKPQERKKIEEQITFESEKALKLFYLSRKLVRDQNIAITNKDVYDEALATYRGNTEQIPKEAYAEAVSKVILLRAQDFIIENAKKS